MPGKITKIKRYRRPYIKMNPESLFVFGDNYVRRGFGGQARECRGEQNAVGIPTKWAPSLAESAFFKDSDFEKIIPRIDEGFEILERHLWRCGTVVWPSDGIGTFLAQLEERAPSIFEYINDRYAKLEKICHE